jgi:hypothetical protein
MLPPAYLCKKLVQPVPTKDGGTLRTIREAWEYMAAISKERKQRRHWQHVRKLILEEADCRGNQLAGSARGFEGR